MNQIAFKWLGVISFNVLHPQAALSINVKSYESLVVASFLSFHFLKVGSM